MVKIFKNFLTEEQCDWFVDFHKNNFLRQDLKLGQDKYNNTEIIVCESVSYIYRIKEFKYLLSKLNFLIKELSEKAFVNYSQIVKWNTGSKQPAHCDRQQQFYTSILYLNEDFKGGETRIENDIFKPEKGKLILFKGNEKEHEVLEIQEGFRYTNATWYSEL